jgi:hypothetical protein
MFLTVSAVWLRPEEIQQDNSKQQNKIVLPLKYDLSANRIAGGFLFYTKSKVFGKIGLPGDPQEQRLSGCLFS